MIDKEKIKRHLGVTKIQKDLDYELAWNKKVSALVLPSEGIEESNVLLEYKKRTAPLMHKIEILLYENGIITLASDSMISPSQDLKAQLSSELLDEIKRLMNENELMNQKSCFQAAMDGHNSELTLFLEKKHKTIFSNNCNVSEFSYSYRCLIFLLSAVGQRMIKSQKKKTKYCYGG